MMRKHLQVGVVAATMVGSMVVAGTASAAPNERASEIGHCSALFGKAGERQEIAHLVRDDDGPPGLFYREVARYKGSEACPAD